MFCVNKIEKKNILKQLKKSPANCPTPPKSHRPVVHRPVVRRPVVHRPVVHRPIVRAPRITTPPLEQTDLFLMIFFTYIGVKYSQQLAFQHPEQRHIYIFPNSVANRQI